MDLQKAEAVRRRVKRAVLCSLGADVERCGESHDQEVYQHGPTAIHGLQLRPSQKYLPTLETNQEVFR